MDLLLFEIHIARILSHLLVLQPMVFLFSMEYMHGYIAFNSCCWMIKNIIYSYVLCVLAHMGGGAVEKKELIESYDPSLE